MDKTDDVKINLIGQKEGMEYVLSFLNIQKDAIIENILDYKEEDYKQEKAIYTAFLDMTYKMINIVEFSMLEIDDKIKNI